MGKETQEIRSVRKGCKLTDVQRRQVVRRQVEWRIEALLRRIEDEGLTVWEFEGLCREVRALEWRLVQLDRMSWEGDEVGIVYVK